MTATPATRASAGPPGRWGFRLRRMRRADLERVLDIERSAFPVPWSPRTFHGLLHREDAALCVAVEQGEGSGGEVLGYAVLWRVVEQAELGNLAVRPDARRRGVGAALLRRALETAAEWGVESVFLEVRVGNRGARRMYEGAGFSEAGRRRGYYTRPREDAIVMRKELRESRSRDPGGAR